MDNLNVEVCVNKAKCMDDLFELISNISELYDLIPDHLQYLANPKVDNITNILKSFVQVNNENN